MGPRRFVAATAAEALKLIKTEIGPEAVVLSNRPVPEGVEIIAIEPDALGMLSSSGSAERRRRLDPAMPPPTLAATTGAPAYGAGVMGAGPGADLPRSRAAKHELVIADVGRRPVRNPDGSPVFEPEVARSTFAAAPAGTDDAPAGGGLDNPRQQRRNGGSQSVDKLMAEVAEVKTLLQSHLAGNYWGQMQQYSPARALVTRRLLSAGFSPQLCSSLLEETEDHEDPDVMIGQIQEYLESHLRSIDAFGLFDEGGVFAFIGPTGVGKTTTVAKVAARCVLRYGRNEVALLTTDTYRIGAQEQLRVFAKILGLPVISLRDSEDMAGKLSELSNRKILLLDTAGVSQRDTLMIEQSQLIRDGCHSVKRILVLSSTTSLQTQEDVIKAHARALKDMPLLAAVITKTDETVHLAPAVDCLIRHNLPLLFLANGQRVPEDLFPANIRYVVHRAVKPLTHDEFNDVTEQQVPAMMSENLSDWIQKTA